MFCFPGVPKTNQQTTPLPWVPLGRIENLRGSRRLAAPPLSHWVPAALAAAPRQGFLGPFGPRAVKSVTTHFRGGQMNPHLRRPKAPQRVTYAFGLP